MADTPSAKAGILPSNGTMDLVTAASLLGIGRTTAYAQARQGTFPVPLIRVGTRLRVLVEPLQAILRGEVMAGGLLLVGHARPFGQRPTPDSQMPSVGQWLTTWLSSRRSLRPSTVRSNEAHLRRYLIPNLGEIPLDQLRVEHVGALFDAIVERNEQIKDLLVSPAPEARARAAGLKIITVATMRRIRATPRVSLNAAIPDLIAVNPARHVELPPTRSPHPLVWTDLRVHRWKATGEVPSALMVWTPTHTRTFLAHARGDRLLPLYHLVAHTGLRRGEACGLHWDDVDLDAATLTVRWQLTQLGWATSLTEPKTVASQDTIALDTGTVAVLRAWQRRQQHERDRHQVPSSGDGFVFTRPDGAPHHPAEVTRRFRQLAASAGLPPIRLHDLRHGAATLYQLVWPQASTYASSNTCCVTHPLSSPRIPTPASCPRSPTLPQRPSRPCSADLRLQRAIRRDRYFTPAAEATRARPAKQRVPS